jgi:hypothetical protein
MSQTLSPYLVPLAVAGSTFGDRPRPTVPCIPDRSGDQHTTFNLPNKSGRVSAMVEAIATLLTSLYFGGNSTLLGAKGGLKSETLTLLN